MRPITHLVVHCSATPANRDIGVEDIRVWHKAKGWKDVGYHYVIRRDGTVEKGRADAVIGAHVVGHNAKSIGVCLVGGVKADMTAEDNFTSAQYAALATLMRELKTRFPHARVCGHRDLSPDRNGDGKVSPGEWVKMCPSFDVVAWWNKINGWS